jgi:hypothetical protein
MDDWEDFISKFSDSIFVSFLTQSAGETIQYLDEPHLALSSAIPAASQSPRPRSPAESPEVESPSCSRPLPAPSQQSNRGSGKIAGLESSTVVAGPEIVEGVGVEECGPETQGAFGAFLDSTAVIAWKVQILSYLNFRRGSFFVLQNTFSIYYN